VIGTNPRLGRQLARARQDQYTVEDASGRTYADLAIFWKFDGNSTNVAKNLVGRLRNF